MNRPRNAAIYCRTSAERGTFEPENANTLAYQVGSAMAFIRDHKLSFTGLYVDEELARLETIGQETGLWRLARDCAAGLIDVIIVRDMNVIAPDNDAIEALEQSALPLVIGAEDLYYTKEDFDLETFRYVDSKPAAISEAMQERIGAGKYVGRFPYGYKRQGEELVADPETAKVVRDIFDAASSGYNAADIKFILTVPMRVPTPSGGRTWSRETVAKILSNKVYYGEDHIEAIISQTIFDQANAVLNEKRNNKEPEPFPMARCDVCNSKLVYQKAGSIPRLKITSYFCNKHKGFPRVPIEKLTQEVLGQCNEFLTRGEDELPDDHERVRKVIELGEKVLAEEEIGEGFDGLWNDWYKTCYRSAAGAWGQNLIRYKYSHWTEFNLETGKWIIKSIRMKEDGSVKVGFWGDGGC